MLSNCSVCDNWIFFLVESRSNRERMEACCGGTTMGSLQQPGGVKGPVFAPVTKFSQQLKFNFPRPVRSLPLKRSLVVEKRASPVSVSSVETSSKRVFVLIIYDYYVKLNSFLFHAWFLITV